MRLVKVGQGWAGSGRVGQGWAGLGKVGYCWAGLGKVSDRFAAATAARSKLGVPFTKRIGKSNYLHRSHCSMKQEYLIKEIETFSLKPSA